MWQSYNEQGEKNPFLLIPPKQKLFILRESVRPTMAARELFEDEIKTEGTRKKAEIWGESHSQFTAKFDRYVNASQRFCSVAIPPPPTPHDWVEHNEASDSSNDLYANM